MSDAKKNTSKTEFMNVEDICSFILKNYNVVVYDIENVKYKNTEKERAVYKIETDKGTKCLKKVYYDKGKLLYIYSVIEWLNAKGIFCPHLISTKKNLKYVNYNNMLFILTDWINGRKCDYDNINDILVSSEYLAKIHSCSYGFKPIEGSSDAINNCNYYESLNKHFKQLMEQSNEAFKIKDKFSVKFLEHFEYNLNASKESLYLLSNINFTKDIGDRVSRRAICHLDYVNKNIIFTDDNSICIIDFDKSAIDYPIHDISNYLRRILKREKTSWDFNICKSAIESYETIRPLSKDEHTAILAMLMFPHKFWKISRDYYKNIKNCNKESFLSILKGIEKQEHNHEIFCKEFKDYIDNKFI